MKTTDLGKRTMNGNVFDVTETDYGPVVYRDYKRVSGYFVRAYGEKWWHRTLEGAEKRASGLHYCHNVHITDCKTGKLVSGRPE
jgi:hypothetical protein